MTKNKDLPVVAPGAPLPPAEFARRLKEDPSSVCFPVLLFCNQFGITFDELLGEVRAGRLIVLATPPTFADATISGKALLDWVSNPLAPQTLVDRACFGPRRLGSA